MQQIRQTVLTRVGTRSHSHSTVSQNNNKTEEEEDDEDSVRSEVSTICEHFKNLACICKGCFNLLSCDTR